MASRGSQKPTSRMGYSKFDPSLHPRDPLGMFAVKGGTAKRERDARLASMDANSAKRQVLGRGPDSAFLDEASVSDLSVIEDDTPSRLLAQYNNGDFGIDTFENKMDQVVARPAVEAAESYGARERKRQTRLAEANRAFPPIEADRPDWERADYLGRPESRAEIEGTLLAAADPGNLAVTTGEIHRLSGGGMADSVVRAQLIGPDGKRLPYDAVIKTAASRDEAAAEMLGAEVGHAIGAPVPVVVPSTNTGRQVYMEHIVGGIGYQTSAPGPADGREMVHAYREGAARLSVLDEITGNRDRHDGNWVLTDQGTPIGIDNGLMFGAGGERFRSPQSIRNIRHGMLSSSASAGWEQMQDRIPTEEMESWRPRLDALGPQFAARGKGDWHRQMMDNYEQVLERRYGMES